MENFVTHIYDQTPIGCGFFVGNYFITAGHVIDAGKSPRISYNGKEYRLKESDAIKICRMNETNRDPNGFDYAIFKLDNINSPLKIAKYKPTHKQEFLCTVYNHKVCKNEDMYENATNIFERIDSINEQIEKLTTSVTVTDEHEGNFFVCESTDILQQGNSGSPLYDKDNNVVGILHGGNIGTSKCVFMYAHILNDIINSVDNAD